MGTVTVVKTVPAMPENELKSWYREQLGEMAREGGTDGYCGNWNSNTGLHIMQTPAGKIFTRKEAEAYLESRVEKKSDVLAIRVGDFGKSFPATAADKDLVTKVADNSKQRELFDLAILERAQKAKSKTKKCAHCESSINVRALHKPTPKEVLETSESAFYVPSLVLLRGLVQTTYLRGLTECPVCGKELLKSPTDAKAEEALKSRLQDLRSKLAAAKTAFGTKQLGKDQPHWLIWGDCGS